MRKPANQERSTGLRDGTEPITRGVAGWAEKRRPEASGTKTELALGERGGSDDARAFFYCDDLIGRDIPNAVIGVAAGPVDYHFVDASVSPKTEGED